MIDNLTRKYQDQSNQLKTVNDNGGLADKGFLYEGDALGQYTFKNGNLTSDPNVKNVKYNHLDLPTYIESKQGSIHITYDADGSKLKQVEVPLEGEAIETIYVGGMEYVNGKRSSLYFAEGRIMYDVELPTEAGPSTRDYVEWSISDHLGNTRIRYIDKNEDNEIAVDDEDDGINELSGSYHYYPFGLAMEEEAR